MGFAHNDRALAQLYGEESLKDHVRISLTRLWDGGLKTRKNDKKTGKPTKARSSALLTQVNNIAPTGRSDGCPGVYLLQLPTAHGLLCAHIPHTYTWYEAAIADSQRHVGSPDGSNLKWPRGNTACGQNNQPGWSPQYVYGWDYRLRGLRYCSDGFCRYSILHKNVSHSQTASFGL